ncbi:hypothetical protein ACHQM5_000857 [Ranunculus cassubicifolius]
MGRSGDFLQLLSYDVSSNIILLLDDPADLVRVASVSRSWRQFVIVNGFGKQLCLKLFPKLSTAAHTIEADSGIHATSCNDPIDLENLLKIHKVYIFVALGLSPCLRDDCISEAISATSTDRYPAETIRNTLVPMNLVRDPYCYWSSKGESDDSVPETLIYKLNSGLCFIDEINVQPFQAHFHIGFPIYSAKAVQFRVRYRKSLLHAILGPHSDGDFERTNYVSPVFPMTQENCLQKFELPEPVLCINGILEIDLLGRVQKQRSDNLYYICVSHVQVVGRALLPGFHDKLYCTENWDDFLPLG